MYRFIRRKRNYWAIKWFKAKRSFSKNGKQRVGDTIKLNKQINDKDVSTIKIIITFVLLILAIFGYITINKYANTDPTDAEKKVTEKTKDDNLSDKDALKIATEKYYMAVATITNTKTDIDKIYNLIKTTDIILTNDDLINKLNKLNLKTYSQSSSISVISNYEEAIKNNFTETFIKENVLLPNGFITNINNEYYLVKDKADNYFFKKVKLSLISKSESELHFTTIITRYTASCVSAGSTLPSITCTDEETSDPLEFILVKDDNKWKIKTMTLIS